MPLPPYIIWSERMASSTAFFPERYSIKDLELFSGIKAHTIRAWERRYKLLEPARSDTNIRSYGADDLRTLLNTSLLLKDGMSISSIAALSGKERDERIRSGIRAKWGNDEALNALKLAMVGYDEELFERTSRNYRSDHGFEALVEQLYLPLLAMIGLLWQSDVICPAQEHFCSNLIRQKIVSAIDVLPLARGEGTSLVALYLPEHEIHELGLLYLQYRLRNEGRRSIYLGESVPLEDLRDVVGHWPGPMDICAILTVFPRPGNEPAYLTKIETLIPDARVNFHFCGPVLQVVPETSLPERIHVYPNIPAMLKALLGGRSIQTDN